MHRKVVENYFSILQDLLIAKQIPVFTKRAKRRVIAHSKFYFFDAGVYQALCPKGPLDSLEEIDGATIETLILQEIFAINDYYDYGYKIYFWRTRDGHEVDIVLYGERGLIAIEVKRGNRLRSDAFCGLKTFLNEYPTAQIYMLYNGNKIQWESAIQILPIENFLKNLAIILNKKIK